MGSLDEQRISHPGSAFTKAWQSLVAVPHFEMAELEEQATSWIPCVAILF
jgi:hypothetical protein